MASNDEGRRRSARSTLEDARVSYQLLPPLLVLVASTLFVSGCFFYDSRWGQAEDAQRNAARDATPVKLDAAQGPRLRRQARVLNVRIYATPQHAAQVFDWPSQFSRYLEVVNQVLVRDHGVELQVSEARPWPTQKTDEALEHLIEELQRADDGQSASWVIGLAGQVPRVEADFRRLGVANVLGKHLVMRTPSDPAEREAIERAFTELSENERESLYDKRRTHRAAAVLLHELGHTLGCVHVEDTSAFMNPLYDEAMEQFAVDNAALVELALPARSDTAAGLDVAVARQLKQRLLQAKEAPWVDASYRQTLLLLEEIEQAAAAPTSLASPSTSPASAAGAPVGAHPGETAIASVETADPPSADPALSPADQVLLRQVQDDRHRGQNAAAWERGQPLFEKYPQSFSVQELRCQIAMDMGWEYSAVSEQCHPMMDLVRSDSQ